MKRTSKQFSARLLACLMLLCMGLTVRAADVEHDFGEVGTGYGLYNEFTVSVSNDPNTINIHISTSEKLQLYYFIDSTNEYTCEFHVFERYGGEREYIPQWQLYNGMPSMMFNCLPIGDYRITITTFSKIEGAESYTVSVGLHTDSTWDNQTPDIPIGFTYISEPEHEGEPDYKDPTYSDIAARSYIREIVPLSANGFFSMETISYFDGLGRPIQTVLKGVTPLRADLVNFTDYNNSGKPWRSWNAIPVDGLYGAFVSDQPKRAKKLLEDTRPYTETFYDPYGMDIPVEQTGAGEEFSGHTTHSALHVNKTSGLYACNRYIVQEETLKTNGVYPKGTLSIIESTDEDERKRLVFKDRMDRVVAEKQMDGEADHSTYYVYTPGGNLAYVLPPALEGNTDSASLYKYAYAYKYDGPDRVTEKKLPGCEPIRYYYDEADRVVFTQDGNQASKEEYSFTLYDLKGRIVVTGLCKCSNPRMYTFGLAQAIPTANNGHYSSGYTFSLMDIATNICLSQVNYYDTYEYLDIPFFRAHKPSLSYQNKEGYGERYVSDKCGVASSYGQLTGSRIFAVNGSSETVTSFYYDDRGNLVQSSVYNHLGVYEHEYISYSFTNQILCRTHLFDSPESRTESYYYTYDHADRLTCVDYRFDSDSLITLSKNEYDEFCRLKSRSIHNGVNRTEYDYNLRDWLTETVNPLFSQTLHYTDSIGTPQYGGNISSMTWKSGDGVTRGYKFTYDPLSRLKDALYGEGTSLSTNSNRFNEQVTGYDKMGNILGLFRYGQTSATDYGLIDNLHLTYDGNQLHSVRDNATHSVFGNGLEFKDGANQMVEYEYDKNGNLTKDLNKNITDIQYNILNLPSQVTFANGSTTKYEYAMNGAKLRTIHTTDGDTLATDYSGNAIYENGELKMLLNEAGYVSFPDKKFHFYLRDHQGNVRVVADKDGNVEETNAYYPFGGTFTSTANVQPYKYNGKELDTKNGLNWHDYGARHYDAAIGRWHAGDPLAEKYYGITPYAYCNNNPIKYVDPDGKTLVIWYQDSKGKTVSYSYSGGNATNSNAFVQSVVTAYNYNKANGSKAGNGGGASTVAAVERKDISINVMESSEEDNYKEFAAKGTIYWRPDLGLKSDNGTVISPATGFDHEADHAMKHKTDPQGFAKGSNTSDTQYDDSEERRVISGSEQKTARANGETRSGQVTRRNHKGTYVITEGVTSTKINNQKTKEYEKNKRVWTSE